MEYSWLESKPMEMQICNEIAEEYSWLDKCINGVKVLARFSNEQVHPREVIGRGKCAAFAARDCMQTLYNITSALSKAAHFPELSVRNLIDAIPNADDADDAGVYPIAYLEYLKAHGITTAKDYTECPISTGGVRNTEGRELHRITGFRGYRDLFYRAKLAEHITDIIRDLNHGPLLGCFAMPEEISYYTGGVIINYQKLYYDEGTTQLKWFGTHAVMIIGFGVTRTSIPFWICQNNWGPRSVGNGIIRIAMSNVYEIWSMTEQATLLPMEDLKMECNEVVSLVMRIASGGSM